MGRAGRWEATAISKPREICVGMCQPPLEWGVHGRATDPLHLRIGSRGARDLSHLRIGSRESKRPPKPTRSRLTVEVSIMGPHTLAERKRQRLQIEGANASAGGECRPLHQLASKLASVAHGI